MTLKTLTTAGLFCFVATLAPGQTKAPTIAAVLGFANNTALSPGAYGFAYVTNLGANPTVSVNGSSATVFSVTPAYVSFQVPTGANIGLGSLIVQSSTGTTAPFAFTINATSPAIADNDATAPISYFFNLTPQFVKDPTPSPGDRVFIYVDGLGASVPPPTPRVLIDGNDIPVLGLTSLNALIGPSAQGPLPAVSVQIPALPGGTHFLTVIAGNATSPAVSFTLIADGLITSQTGLTFNSVQNGPQPPPQSFSVTSGQGALNFSLAVSTVSGGNWLAATPLQGTANSGVTGTPVQVTAKQTGLAAGTYYGQIVVSAPGVPNSPQIVTIVLTVVPANTSLSPSIDKTGLIFVASPGGAGPGAQRITLFNPTSANVAFSANLATPPGSLNPFQTSVSSGTLTPGQSLAVSVQASASNPAAVYSAQLTFNFASGTSHVANLLLILAGGATPSSSAKTARIAAPTCIATRLLPVFTLLGDNFTVPAAWPTPLQAAIADDCGAPLTAGTVVVAFSNGDPPLRLTSNLNGMWSATWPPANARPSGIVLTLTAQQQETNLSGSAQISGGVSANPNVPIVSQGGVVETASYASPASPGDLIAIFGANLATSTAQATSVPLPQTLATTSAALSAQPLPLFYASSGQVNAVVPYGLPTNTRYQLVIQLGNSISVPQSVLIGVARPAAFTLDGSGQGQAHVYKIDAKGNQIRADQNAPAKAGDVLVIYCSGLGAVTPPLTAGTMTPLGFLTNTVSPVTVTFGGLAAQVAFAGLTPGSVSLYQINATVPSGLPNNPATPLQISVAGQQSNATATFAVQN